MFTFFASLPFQFFNILTTNISSPLSDANKIYFAYPVPVGSVTQRSHMAEAKTFNSNLGSRRLKAEAPIRHLMIYRILTEHFRVAVQNLKTQLSRRCFCAKPARGVGSLLWCAWDQIAGQNSPAIRSQRRSQTSQRSSEYLKPGMISVRESPST